MSRKTKKTNAPSSITITDKVDAYMAVTEAGKPMFFPHNGEGLAKAKEADRNDDPATTSGFLVYDSGVSTEYAVACYGDKSKAETHKPVATQAPELFSEDDEMEQDEA